MIDVKPYMEEIRDVYLDPCELQYEYDEWTDEDGLHSSIEYESTKLQDIKVEKLLLKLAGEVGDELARRLFPGGLQE